MTTQKTAFILCLALVFVALAEKPTAAQQDGPQGSAKAATPAPIAAAKQLALQLGGRLQEDAQGNVISIDMAASRTWADDYQMEQILVFPKLASLTLEGPNITSQLIPRIARQEHLVSLTLKNTLVDDNGIAQLTGLKKLKIVDLRTAPLITDRAMESLVKLPGLRAVRLVGGNVTDRGVATLSRVERLSELDVRTCRGVTKAGIATIAGKKSLRMLKLGGPAIDDRVLEIVGGMKQLTGLCLDTCDVTEAGLAKLGGLSLQDLTLCHCLKATDRGLTALANYKELRRLALEDVPAKGAVLAKLPNPAGLVSLSVAQSGITDAETPSLAKLSRLENLNLRTTAITDASVEAISKLTSLKELTLSGTRVTDAGAQRLRQALPRCKIRMN